MCSIIIPGVKECRSVPVMEILRVEALSNYSCIYFVDGKKIVAAKVLQWFEDRLPADQFARVHRSHLINRGFVRYNRGVLSNTVLMCNGEKINVSRRKRMLLHKIFFAMK